MQKSQPFLFANMESQDAERDMQVSNVTLAAVKSGEIWRDLLREDDDLFAVRFEVAHLLFYHPDFFFHPTLATKIPKDCGVRLLLLFPATADRPVIDTALEPSIAKINERINRYLERTNPKETQLVVCVGRSRYKVRGIPAESKLYLQWASNLAIYRGKVPTHWTNIPLLAATDGHFAQWASFPFFGQGQDRSFIDVRNKLRYVLPPCGLNPWTLDMAVPDLDQLYAFRVLGARRVAHLAVRETVPDHELPLYQAPPVSLHRQVLDGFHVTGTSTDDDSSGITVFATDFPTPRDTAHLHKVEEDAVLGGFFSAMEANTTTATTQLTVEDFAADSESSYATPTTVQFAAPQDSSSRRLVLQPCFKSE